MKRLLVPALALVALAATAPARAQSSSWLDKYRPSYGDAGQPYYDARRVAYDNGYREGLEDGEKDARKREPFRWEDEKAWQRADKGYRREYGDIARYQHTFRGGYADGYRDGYRRYARSYGDGRYDTRGAYPPYPGNGRYPDRYPDQYGRYGAYSPAFDNGARDGYEKGLEDARKGRPYDSLRHEWYRSADRDYEREYGDRERYKDVYREGFKAGYDRGYRGAYRY